MELSDQNQSNEHQQIVSYDISHNGFAFNLEINRMLEEANVRVQRKGPQVFTEKQLMQSDEHRREQNTFNCILPEDNLIDRILVCLFSFLQGKVRLLVKKN